MIAHIPPLLIPVLIAFAVLFGLALVDAFRNRHAYRGVLRYDVESDAWVPRQDRDA